MRGVNKVIVVGTLGADPEVKQFSNGGSVANISVATSEQWTDKQTGEKKEATEWHRVQFSNRLAEIAAQYLRKGSQVYIEGSLKTRKWQDQNGQDRYTTEIRAVNMQMLGGKSSGGGQPMGQMGGGMPQGQPMDNNFGGGYQNNQPNNQQSNQQSNQQNSQAGFQGQPSGMPNNMQNGNGFQNQGNSFSSPQAQPMSQQASQQMPQPASQPMAQPAPQGMAMQDAPADDDIPF